MTYGKLTCLLLFYSILFGSGGFDNGTATGKGKFQIDITLNPFDIFEFGQTYSVMSYGITERFDIHGYISRHKGPFYTWYGGLFYQFYKKDKIDLATAIGIRKRFDKTWSHIFSPQILYNVNITEKVKIGGSMVNIYNYNTENNYGLTFDIALGYSIPLKNSFLESIRINVGGFHPVTWSPDTYFLPTYSLDIKFK